MQMMITLCIMCSHFKGIIIILPLKLEHAIRKVS